jgi:hypothetical protein
MHDAIKTFFLVFRALFPIVDPLSASPKPVSCWSLDSIINGPAIEPR